MTDIDMLAIMMHRQSGLQHRKGYNFMTMTIDQKIQYIKDMVLAATDELHEALRETKWKPWAEGPRAIRRDEYLAELTDVMHFLLNMYLVAGATSDEIYELFIGKNDVNLQRDREGYDGHWDKSGDRL